MAAPSRSPLPKDRERDRLPIPEMRTLRWLILVVLLSLSPAKGSARDFFFDADAGSDEADGSEHSPLRSIAHANSMSFAPGDRLLFRGGQTFTGNLILAGENQGTVETPIVVGTCGTGRAVIDAGLGTGIWIRNLGGIVIQDLIILGAGPGKNVGSGVRIENTLPGATVLDYVRVLRVACSGFGGYPGPLWEGYGGPSNFGDGIFVGGRPSDRTKSGYRDVRIEDCETSGNQYCGIYVTGAWNPAIDSFANQDVHVVGCSAHHNLGDPLYHANHSGDGILVEDVDGATIEHCAAWENGALCGCPFGGPVGIWTYSANAVVIRDCLSFSNRTGSLDGAGFDLDGGVSNSIIERCVSHDNDGAGILLYTYPGSPHYFGGNIVRDNLSANDGKKNHMAGIAIGRHGGKFEGLEIYRNTVVASSKSGSNCAISIFGQEARDIRLHHNLIAVADGAHLLNAVTQPGLSLSDNAYASGQSPFLMEFDGQLFESLAELRNDSGQEMSPGDETHGHMIASIPADLDHWMQTLIAQASARDLQSGLLARKDPTPVAEPAASPPEKPLSGVIQALGILLPPGF